MKIVHVASELFPYIKTGGLADAVAALSGTLADFGHEVSVFLPGYRPVLEHPEVGDAEEILSLRVGMGNGFLNGELRRFAPRKGVTVYLICRDESFDRRAPYGNGRRDYEDNHYRFIFFCKAVVESLRLLDLRADVVHCHDWQTGLLPLLLRHAEARYQTTLALKTVFTVHNIAFQGVFPMNAFKKTNLPEELMGIDGVEYYGQMSMMKGGLLFADRITTVSPRYADEIQTTEFGCGLEGVVRSRVADLSGLINGIDPAVWNPRTDKHLPARYSADDLTGKALCRAELLTQAGLEAGPEVPIFGLIARLTAQKGIELILANKNFFVKHDVRFIVLGTGDLNLQAQIAELAASHPTKVVHLARLDEAMSHLVEAGADFFLMPSLFEPCGLNQMYSQAYGTVPIASRVGGLADTIVDIDTHPDTGTGILVEPERKALREGLERALDLFVAKDDLWAVQQRGMRRDFSWASAARAYEQLYVDAL